MTLEGRLKWARRWKSRGEHNDHPYLLELAEYEKNRPEDAKALAAVQDKLEAEKREVSEDIAGSLVPDKKPVSKRGRPKK